MFTVVAFIVGSASGLLGGLFLGGNSVIAIFLGIVILLQTWTILMGYRSNDRSDTRRWKPPEEPKPRLLKKSGRREEWKL